MFSTLSAKCASAPSFMGLGFFLLFFFFWQILFVAFFFTLSEAFGMPLDLSGVLGGDLLQDHTGIIHQVAHCAIGPHKRIKCALLAEPLWERERKGPLPSFLIFGYLKGGRDPKVQIFFFFSSLSHPPSQESKTNQSTGSAGELSRWSFSHTESLDDGPPPKMALTMM